jgi:hypothetical protein
MWRRCLIAGGDLIVSARSVENAGTKKGSLVMYLDEGVVPTTKPRKRCGYSPTERSRFLRTKPSCFVSAQLAELAICAKSGQLMVPKQFIDRDVRDLASFRRDRCASSICLSHELAQIRRKCGQVMVVFTWGRYKALEGDVICGHVMVSRI